ncbi:hypothetical protein PPL_03271 [Heterostelium album PN500]|uniref:Uncharacterized protein n=1 Tax=Heterostelium pallidum (strain ATCC 26659 / Pp 5 / PN500) TaxID=670386 RepID=D3B4E7_HETP5|nr:hypothetical protein PPL_03271 [Heterostelium album PN500]EFA84195.1 hypothetical protein PPL_03271 [Heterostelium album PN500]|eukprot:XP_020436311.1 hypothetical protein PPL_03271 [Heterostelium album PN500]
MSLQKNYFQIILNNKYISNIIFCNVYRIHKFVVGIGKRCYRYNEIGDVEWMLLNRYTAQPRHRSTHCHSAQRHVAIGAARIDAAMSARASKDTSCRRRQVHTGQHRNNFEQIHNNLLFKCPLQNIQYILSNQQQQLGGGNNISTTTTMMTTTNNNTTTATTNDQIESVNSQRHIIRYSGSILAAAIGNSLEVLQYLLNIYQHQPNDFQQDLQQQQLEQHSYAINRVNQICDTLDEAIESAFFPPSPYKMECNNFTQPENQTRNNQLLILYRF